MKVQADILVAKVKNGDTAAFSELYDQYSPALYGLILKIVGDDMLAQDILQEAFVKIWTKINSFEEGKGTIFTWMLNICRNRAIDEIRKTKRAEEGQQNLGYENENQGFHAHNVDTIGLTEILVKLPEEQRLLVDYLYFKGYTQQEVSDELGIPLGTVKTRSRLALSALRNSFLLILLLWILKHT